MFKKQKITADYIVSGFVSVCVCLENHSDYGKYVTNYLLNKRFKEVEVCQHLL